jgi:hypothetical protein
MLTLESHLAPKKLGAIIYYGWSSETAVGMAKKMREAGQMVVTRDAHVFTGDIEPCNSVLIMSDVHPKCRARVEAAYGDKVISTVEAPKPEPIIDPVAPPVGDHTELAESIKRRPGRPRKEIL